jgi:hypothetical protein
VRAKALISLALLPLLAGCWWPVPEGTVTPKQVNRYINLWNGKVVTVGGWIGTCAGYDCRLFSTEADMRIVMAGNSDSPEWHKAFGRGLGIGSAEGFDQAAAPLQGTYVLIKGRVNDICHPWLGSGGCLDRAADIEPISIQAAKPPKEST